VVHILNGHGCVKNNYKLLTLSQPGTGALRLLAYPVCSFYLLT